MRSFAKFALGSLLGISLVLTGSTQAKADNCLLIVCVDAPVVGPVVGTIGDVLEEVLSPSRPTTPSQPPTQPQPPVQPPVQEPTTPTQPQSPTSPSTGGGQPAAPTESGNSDEVIDITDGTVIQSPLPVPTPSHTIQPSPTPSMVPSKEADEEIADGNHVFQHISVLTPYIVGVLVVLLLVLLVTSAVRIFRPKKSLPWYQDTSALPWDLKSRK